MVPLHLKKGTKGYFAYGAKELQASKHPKGTGIGESTYPRIPLYMLWIQHFPLSHHATWCIRLQVPNPRSGSHASLHHRRGNLPIFEQVPSTIHKAQTQSQVRKVLQGHHVKTKSHYTAMLRLRDKHTITH